MAPGDPFGARTTLRTRAGECTIYALEALERQGMVEVARLPYALRILLEGALRHAAQLGPGSVAALTRWQGQAPADAELQFMPARVLLQDLTGVPAVVDLAAMRDAMATRGGPVEAINPLVPVDLVIDHSVQVDAWGSGAALEANVALEYARNRERYALLRWAQGAFRGLRVVPPGTGIVHQVNLEYLASVVQRVPDGGGGWVAFPDSLVGTDSHTTMVNGIGVLGWGVGGIEAEAVMLGQPYGLPVPPVVGMRLSGALPPGATATDLVLTVTELLRRHGVVGKFVEFIGPGASALPVPDRATLANMAPEYGATVGFFPVDAQTLRYLRETGRSADTVELVERYCRQQRLFRSPADPEPLYSELVELDLATVEPCVAGPRRPQDRVPLAAVPATLRGLGASAAPAPQRPTAAGGAVAVAERTAVGLRDGAVAIAAITSCTNTSNPSVMIAAGLLARKAVERGLQVLPHVKTSLAPGSRVVTDYLQRAGLLPYLEALGFAVVGYGCTTCIGNSGELTAEAAEAARQGVLLAAILSGNRNFEGRIHPAVRANYLASPPLVVAYALAGFMDVDLNREPLGKDAAGRPVYLRELWPSAAEVEAVARQALVPELFTARYAEVFTGDLRWQSLGAEGGEMPARFPWDPSSTYIRRPPFFDGRSEAPGMAIRGARVLALLGDSITTDHISPAGSIAPESPAAQWLRAHGVAPADFNTYGSRRGNHEVMVRGTFGNVRLRNHLAPEREGGFTRHFPDGRLTTIYEAAQAYAAEGVPLMVIAGRDYGTGSSRDWAAKGPRLLGVRAVLAVSFERIHRSNLVGMGILPLQFLPGEDADRLGLRGDEVYDVLWEGDLAPHQRVAVRVQRMDGASQSLEAQVRLDSPREVELFLAGGILPHTLDRLVQGPAAG